MGGIQYQIIDVNGKAINKAAWGEHIWLDEQARNGKNFYTLLGIARENITKNGGEVVFMEFNNPDKMSVEQMLMDEAAGLSAKDREKNLGSHRNQCSCRQQRQGAGVRATGDVCRRSASAIPLAGLHLQQAFEWHISAEKTISSWFKPLTEPFLQ